MGKPAAPQLPIAHAGAAPTEHEANLQRLAMSAVGPSAPAGSTATATGGDSTAGAGASSGTTPVDPRFRHGPLQVGQRLAWEDFVSGFVAHHRPWWLGSETYERRTETSEPLQIAALRAIAGRLACTRRA